MKPAREQFPFIYREAMEVHWDETSGRLYGPKPREWTLVMWFQQITDAAREQGVELRFGPATRWVDIPGDLRGQIETR